MTLSSHLLKLFLLAPDLPHPRSGPVSFPLVPSTESVAPQSSLQAEQRAASPENYKNPMNFPWTTVFLTNEEDKCALSFCICLWVK